MTMGPIGLFATVFFPLAGSALLTFYPWRQEKQISRIALFSTFASSVSACMAIVAWIAGGFYNIETAPLTLVQSGSYHFIFQFSLDVMAVGFLFLVEFTSGMVIRFSRIYLHREPGYRRFFATVLMFQGGMALLTLASNLDLLFCGWELVGLSSFLLIAFYHERQAPVRNALKTFSIYRLADLGMFLGAFMEHKAPGAGVGLLLLLAAAGKSAQVPFSFWIVRAMEGPTPSSALFYGALSINAGAYLLLRTYSIWGQFDSVHLAIGVVGLSTAILCTMFSRVQHTIKGQVGYASATQVGFIFMELALGLRWLALFHMISNAVLRCYQLLVSPSAVAYLLRQQSSSKTTALSENHSLFQRMLTREGRSSLYVFAISEGYLEVGLRKLIWEPLHFLGRHVARFKFAFLGALLVLAIIAAALVRTGRPESWLPLALIGAGLYIGAISFSVAAINSTDRPLKALVNLTASSFLTTLAVFITSHEQLGLPSLEYTLGIAAMCGIAALGFQRVSARFGTVVPRYAGLTSGHPIAAWVVLTAALGIAGFPLLPTFFGEDILLNAAFNVNPLFAFGLSGLFALNGYIAVRGFALSFFGAKG